MSNKLKLYIGSVITAGGAVLGLSLWWWDWADPKRFLVYLTLALIASGLKVRLPGIDGTYSLGFLFVLVGVLHFSLAETLLVGCGGALVQTLWNTKQRPTLVQVLFNVGNLSLSIGLCFGLAHGPVGRMLGTSTPTVLGAAACLFFVINTGLVSGVLSLLQGKSLGEVSQQWYLWSFPYYLVGAVLVSLLPLSGRSVPGEAWLLLLPPIFLVHFYYGLSFRKGLAQSSTIGDRGDGLSPAARIYLGSIVAAGLTLLTWSVVSWQVNYFQRFIVYLAVALVASAWKVSLPRLTGTVSVNFILLLAAIIELSLPEAVVIAAAAALVQCLWGPKQRPKPIRVLFSLTGMALSVALAFGICRHWLEPEITDSLVALLVMATACLYLSNTLLVALAWCLAEGRPLRDIWQQCCFWSLPYYLVGAGFAALMIVTSRAVGWQQAFVVLPLMVLVYVSYRLHVDKAAEVARAVPQEVGVVQ